jgi:hypothetical protein
VYKRSVTYCPITVRTRLRSVTRDELYLSVNASENSPSLREYKTCDERRGEERGGGEGRRGERRRRGEERGGGEEREEERRERKRRRGVMAIDNGGKGEGSGNRLY